MGGKGSPCPNNPGVMRAHTMHLGGHHWTAQIWRCPPLAQDPEWLRVALHSPTRDSGHPSLSSFISCHSLCPLQAAAHQVRPLAAFPLPLLLLRMLFLMPLWFHSEPICPWSESPGACKCMCYIKEVLPGEHSKGWGAGNGAGEEASKGQAGAGAWGWSTLGQGWRPQEMPGLTGR